MMKNIINDYHNLLKNPDDVTGWNANLARMAFLGMTGIVITTFGAFEPTLACEFVNLGQ